jgi:hypothetical protein
MLLILKLVHAPVVANLRCLQFAVLKLSNRHKHGGPCSNVIIKGDCDISDVRHMTRHYNPYLAEGVISPKVIIASNPDMTARSYNNRAAMCAKSRVWRETSEQ